jgi:hypothetical protein
MLKLMTRRVIEFAGALTAVEEVSERQSAAAIAISKARGRMQP